MSHPLYHKLRAELEKHYLKIEGMGFKHDHSVITHSWLLNSGGNDAAADDHADDDSNDAKNEAKECHLKQHSKKLAIGLGLLVTKQGLTLHVVKNLHMCSNCHEATKFLTKVTQWEIVVHNSNQFHHFTPDGRCSCGDYW